MKKILIIVSAMILVVIAAAGIFIMTFTIDEMEIEKVSIKKNKSAKKQPEAIVWHQQTGVEQPILPSSNNTNIPTVNFGEQPPEQTVNFQQSASEERKKRWQERMDNPEFKKKMEERERSMLSNKYKSLFNYLELTQEKKDEFYQAIIDQNNSFREMGVRIFGNVSNGVTEENIEDVKNIKEEYLRAMEGILGADDYGVYIQYEQTEPEREQVERLEKELSNTKSEPLSSEQQDELITAMYNARKNIDVYVLTKVDDLPDDDFLKGDNLEKQLNGLDKLAENYIAQASEILSAGQLTQFERSVAEHTERQKKAINFVANRTK
ncbi:MAG: hypothetical protein PF692_10160 [Kiritimatiellae bacterium]|jgi:hypothetical protein|nr:hypothetical protein [Kiritimatiellia bacterium]